MFNEQTQKICLSACEVYTRDHQHEELGGNSLELELRLSTDSVVIKQAMKL
jgi:hypothetical protein